MASAHNSFLQVGSELGFPGFIAFCFIIVSTIANLKKIAKAQDVPQADAAGEVPQKSQNKS